MQAACQDPDHGVPGGWRSGCRETPTERRGAQTQDVGYFVPDNYFAKAARASDACLPPTGTPSTDTAQWPPCLLTFTVERPTRNRAKTPPRASPGPWM